MSKSQLKRSFEALKKPGQSFREYFVQEIERCAEQLGQALESAAKDRDGKPVFYTILRHCSASGMSRTISLHYINQPSGEIYQLNYVASVLLGLPMDQRRDGVVIKGCGMDMGFSLVYDLGRKAVGDGYTISHRWL